VTDTLVELNIEWTRCAKRDPRIPRSKVPHRPCRIGKATSSMRAKLVLPITSSRPKRVGETSPPWASGWRSAKSRFRLQLPSLIRSGEGSDSPKGHATRPKTNWSRRRRQDGVAAATNPRIKPAALVQWGSVTPFVLKSADQFRCPDPPAVNSPRALADLEEVKAIGGSKSATRTAEQSEIARYWYENSPQGWNRIAREVLAARQFDVWENARLSPVETETDTFAANKIIDRRGSFGLGRPSPHLLEPRCRPPARP
jgi:hypothetical protein